MTLRDKPLRLFITHGRATELKGQLRSWLRKRTNPAVEPLDLATSSAPGEYIPAGLERVAANSDAVIVLATPDDEGRLRGDPKLPLLPRARQNVWMEVGWFWARLGRNRTLLLIQGNDLEVPSNYSAVKHVRFTESFHEKPAITEIDQFLRSLRNLEPDSLTEVAFSSADPLKRAREWEEVHHEATTSLIITGISMGKVRDRLPSLLGSMAVDRLNLELHLVVVHPEFMSSNYELFEAQHGKHAVRDNHSFFDQLLVLMNDSAYSTALSRVILHLYRGFPSFCAVVSDGPQWGSAMIAQTYIPQTRNRDFGYPRTKLIHRAKEGVYSTYWHAVEHLIQNSEILVGKDELERLVRLIPRRGPSL